MIGSLSPDPDPDPGFSATCMFMPLTLRVLCSMPSIADIDFSGGFVSFSRKRRNLEGKMFWNRERESNLHKHMREFWVGLFGCETTSYGKSSGHFKDIEQMVQPNVSHESRGIKKRGTTMYYCIRQIN